MSLPNHRTVTLAAVPALIAGLTLAAAPAAHAAQPVTATLDRHSKTSGVLVTNVGPNLPGALGYRFELQQKSSSGWTTVLRRTTQGANETRILPKIDSGTYRVVVPAQHGRAAGTSAPLAYTAPTAKVRLTKRVDRANVRVSPALPSKRYTVSLQRRTANGWSTYTTRKTSGSVERARFTSLPRGTFRAVVSDHAGIKGASSRSVKVTVTRAQLQARKAKIDRAKLVSVARAQVGKRYVLGATGPSAFDCSGLVGYTYRTALGINLPRTASQQYYAPQLKKRFRHGQGKPEKGDIIYFLNSGAQHVGIYVGGGKMVHAANPGTGVQLTTYNMGWYSRTITGYGRVVA